MPSPYKHIGFLTKHPDQPFDEFVQYWRTAHADLAKELPGLRKYVLNPIDKSVYPDSPVDGFAELWFDSREAAEVAWASQEGAATSADARGFLAALTVVNLHEIEIV
ncbi:EthD family reductase [Nocardia gipuzkoensis]